MLNQEHNQEAQNAQEMSKKLAQLEKTAKKPKISPIQTLLADYRPDASLATPAWDPVGSSTETAGAAELAQNAKIPSLQNH